MHIKKPFKKKFRKTGKLAYEYLDGQKLLVEGINHAKTFSDIKNQQKKKKLIMSFFKFLLINKLGVCF